MIKLLQSICLAAITGMVNIFASLFNCTPMGHVSDSILNRYIDIYVSRLGADLVLSAT